MENAKPPRSGRTHAESDPDATEPQIIRQLHARRVNQPGLDRQPVQNILYRGRSCGSRSGEQTLVSLRLYFLTAIS